jgi:predicted ribosome quality control (RQC) complex YloA/Tae2 family protein
MAAEVNTLLGGSWVQNIYTTNEDAKTFLFKVTGRGDKYLLLLESGVRFHPTEFVRDKSEMPSGFAMKLRKHVRGRRLEYCRQVGLDRVVDFAFGKGTQHQHVVVRLTLCCCRCCATLTLKL